MNNLTFKFTKQTGKGVHSSLSRVHYIQEIGESEREALGGRYENDTSAYHTSIKFFDSDKSMLAAETIEDFQKAGVAFVNIGGGKFAPAATIAEAESFTKADADELEAKKDTTLKVKFRSRVKTIAGNTFLTVRQPSQLIDSRDKALAEVAGIEAPKVA